MKPKAFLCDVWGVIHNGVKLYDDVLPFAEYCKKNDIKLILFSNAPRITSVVSDFLSKTFGFEKDKHYFDITTSGEVFIDTYKNLKDKKCFFIGEDKDLFMIDVIGAIKTDNINDVEFTLITGEYCNEKDNQIVDILNDLKNKNIPAYCPNPDLSAHKNGVIMNCAGFVAEQYKNIGGTVISCGKPYPQMYEYALNKFNLEKQDVIAIGDSLRTDIAGANTFGIESVMVLTGISKIEDIVDEKPTFIIKNLSEIYEN